MNTTVNAIFDSVDAAEKAGGALLDHGVKPKDLSIVGPHGEPVSSSVSGPVSTDAGTGVAQTSDRFGADALGTHPEYHASAAKADDNAYDNLASQENEHNPEDAAKAGITTTTPADAGHGAAVGTGVGAGLGTLAALASIFVPGFGLLAGGGALAIALGGIAASAGAGAIAGGVTGYLKDQGMDDARAKEYGDAISGGGVLLSVQIRDEGTAEDEVRAILTKYGASRVGNNSGPYVA